MGLKCRPGNGQAVCEEYKIPIMAFSLEKVLQVLSCMYCSRPLFTKNISSTCNTNVTVVFPKIRSTRKN
jgi:hypothetical protein